MELLCKRREIEASCHLEKSAKERWGAGLGKKEKGPEDGKDIVLYNENPHNVPMRNPPRMGSFILEWRCYRTRADSRSLSTNGRKSHTVTMPIPFVS